MGHLLSTMNPAEAAELQGNQGAASAVAAELAQTGSLTEPEPISTEGMPEIGDWVLYQPRRGEGRRGRYRIPALVVWVHPGTRLLDLVIFYDANDMGDQQRIPEAAGEDRGWLLKPRSGDSHQVDALCSEVVELRSVLLGDYERPTSSMFALLDAVGERMDELEAQVKALKRGK